jgi:hypothetical protein
MLTQKLKEFLNQGLGMGLGTRGADLAPDFNRVLGAYAVDDDHVTIFIDEPSSWKALANIRDNQMMSIVGVNMITVESYQLKGKNTGIANLTEEQEQLFKLYMEDFDVTATKIGLPLGLVYRYPHSSMIAVTMEVNEIFEQTPKKGTGNKI